MEWNADRLYKLYWTDTYCISKSRHYRTWHCVYFCPSLHQQIFFNLVS